MALSIERFRLHWTVAVALLLLLPCVCQAGWVETQETGPVSARDKASDKIWTTIAEGRAPITDGDMASAKEKATNRALRAAIEKIIGVYVESSTRVEEFQLTKDEILTHSEGYAYIQEVLSEGAADGIYHVKARIGVVDKLSSKLSPFTRRWRVMVVIPERHLQSPIVDPAAETAVVGALIEEKYRLMDQTLASKLRYDADIEAARRGDTEAIKRLFSRCKADILVVGEAFSQRVGSLGGGLVSCRSRVEVKAIRRDSGEIISSRSSQQGGVDVTEEMAAKTALERAGKEVAKQLLADIHRLPAATVLPVEVIISGCASATMLAKIEAKLRGISGVRSVQRDEFDHGVAYLEVSVDSASLSDLQTAIEKIDSPTLEVERSSRNSIEVRVL